MSDNFDRVANPDLKRGIRELQDHAYEYRKARLYADGQSPELFLLSEAARRAVTRYIDEYRLNFAALPIRIIADRLSIMDFQTGDDSHAQEIIERNKFWQWSSELILDTLTDGDAYVVLSDDGEGRALLNPVDAMTTRVIYDDELERVPQFAVRGWELRGTPDGENATVRSNLWYPDRVERYIDRKGNGWEPFEDDGAPWSYEHGFAGLPVVHFRTRAPYGRPEHRDAYGPQDMIVKLVMTFVAAVEYTGWPQRYALQEAALVGQGQLPGMNLPGQAPPNQAPLTASPGSLWELYAKEVGSFPAADLGKLSAGVEFAVRSMAQVTRTPFHYFDPSGDVPSGESLRMADAPVAARTGHTRRSVTWASDEMMSLALTYEGGPSEVTTVWAPDVPLTDREWWETAAIKEGLGVSRERIWAEAGYTEEAIAEFTAGQPANDNPLIEEE